MIVTQVIPIPEEQRRRLDDLLSASATVIRRMFTDRTATSTRFFPEVPSVVAKSLSAKYQRNPRCRSVTNLVLPICGDKGRQIKVVPGGIRIPAVFKKIVIPVAFRLPVVGHIKQVELMPRNGGWTAAVSYETSCKPEIKTVGCIGVDRNSVGNIAVLADSQTGKVEHLGFNPARTKEVWRGRREKLQKVGKNRLLYKIKRKQSRQTKLQNHIVSKRIVDYAATHRRAIAIEELKNVVARGSKIRRFSQSSQWSFAQLESFIRYKAALRGVPVVSVPAEYTSQECSRCGQIQKPEGKKYSCGSCGHNDHRDANAGFNIAKRGNEILNGGVPRDSVSLRRGLLIAPSPGNVSAAG